MIFFTSLEIEHLPDTCDLEWEMLASFVWNMRNISYVKRPKPGPDFFLIYVYIRNQLRRWLPRHPSNMKIVYKSFLHIIVKIASFCQKCTCRCLHQWNDECSGCFFFMFIVYEVLSLWWKGIQRYLIYLFHHIISTSTRKMYVVGSRFDLNMYRKGHKQSAGLFHI